MGSNLCRTLQWYSISKLQTKNEKENTKQMRLLSLNALLEWKCNTECCNVSIFTFNHLKMKRRNSLKFEMVSQLYCRFKSMGYGIICAIVPMLVKRILRNLRKCIDFFSTFLGIRTVFAVRIEFIIAKKNQKEMTQFQLTSKTKSKI